MPKKEVPFATLNDYLPAGSYELVMNYLRAHQVHLTIARERKTLLGDYRHRTSGTNHRISINGNLNPYSFLITLLHELAHLITHEEFGNRVLSHGTEWKNKYSRLLHEFLLTPVFPEDIKKELAISMKNPAASCNGEVSLLRVLKKYDQIKSEDKILVEELMPAAFFRTDDGKVFQRHEQIRKRYKCIEVKTGRVYYFSPISEVEKV